MWITLNDEPVYLRRFVLLETFQAIPLNKEVHLIDWGRTWKTNLEDFMRRLREHFLSNSAQYEMKWLTRSLNHSSLTIRIHCGLWLSTWIHVYVFRCISSICFYWQEFREQLHKWHNPLTACSTLRKKNKSRKSLLTSNENMNEPTFFQALKCCAVLFQSPIKLRRLDIVCCYLFKAWKHDSLKINRGVWGVIIYHILELVFWILLLKIFQMENNYTVELQKSSNTTQ